MSMSEKKPNKGWCSLMGVFFLMGLAACVATFYVYAETKKAYRKVGFNDGVIAANTEMIKVLRKYGSENSDCSNHDRLSLTEIARAKADSVYAVRTTKGILLCEYGPRGM